MKLTEQQRQAFLESMRRSDGRYAIRSTVAVSEFKGTEGVDYPVVQTSDQVDVATLTEGDDKPFFVTLKVAHAGIVSGNGFYYGDEEANEIMRQIVAKRLTGGRGHLRDDELSSALPANPLHWVGALRQNEFVWGKGYIAAGETRDWMRRLGATRSQVATSIFGYADEIYWDETHEAFRMVIHAPDEAGNTGVTFEYVDLASPERAGVPSLATLPHITTEMQHDREDTPTMDKIEIIRAMTPDDARLLPVTVVQAIVAQSDEAKRLTAAEQQLGELRTALGVDDTANLIELVTAQAKTLGEQARQAVDHRITELVNDEQAGVKVPGAIAIVADLIRAEKPATVDAVQSVFEQVMARESVKALLTAEVTRTMGPRQARPVQTGDSQQTQFLKPKPQAATA